MTWEEAPPRRGIRRPVLLAIVGVVIAAAAGVAVASQRSASEPLTVGPTSEAAQARGATEPAALTPQSLGPMIVASEVAGDAPLLDGAPELTVVAARRQALVFIDIATGDARDVQLPRTSLTAAGVGTMFVVGADLIVNHQGTVLRLAADGGDAQEVVRNHRAIPTYDDASLWMTDRLTSAVATTATRFAPDGSVLDHVHLPAVARPVAGTAAGLVVSAPGGISLVRGDSAHVIATGDLIASNGERIARAECDTAVTCLVVLGTIDDPDQVRIRLADEDIPAGYFGLPTGSFSPDGEWLAFPLYRIDGTGSLEQPRIVVIDTTTGTEVARVDGAFARVTSVLPIAWSPDSQWLFASSTDGITVWSAATREAAPLATDIEPPRSLAVLPTAP